MSLYKNMGEMLDLTMCGCAALPFARSAVLTLQIISLTPLSTLYLSLPLLFTTHLTLQCLIADVGLYTFQEAFDKTGRIINITVAPNNNYDPPRYALIA